jgi:hypothetical protein
VIIPDEATTNMGAVETWEDAKKWRAHFRVGDHIDGVLILARSLPKLLTHSSWLS